MVNDLSRKAPPTLTRVPHPVDFEQMPGLEARNVIKKKDLRQKQRLVKTVFR
jgi:hypothetical protein